VADEPKVVALFSKRPIEISPLDQEMDEFRQQAITELEEIIDLFRKGELVGFAMVFTYTDGGSGSAVSAEVQHTPIEFIGALERVKHKINLQADCDEGIFGSED